MKKEKKSNAGRKPYTDRSQLRQTVRFSIKSWVIEKYGGIENMLKPQVLKDNK